MKIILIAYLLFLVCLNSGCSMLAVLDTSSDFEDDRKVSQEIDEERTRLENLYVGASKIQVLSELGKPKKIIKEKCKYLINSDEFGPNAKLADADEKWLYEFKKKIQNSYYVYSISIYFIDDKVVAVP